MNDPTDVSRRAWLSRAAGLGAAVGASALAAGCLDVALAPVDETDVESLALDGAPVGWADAVGTPAHPLDLRTMTPGGYAVVIAKGFLGPGDGGGGVFTWTTDPTAADDGGRVIVPSTLPRTGCWKRVEASTLNVRWFGARGDGTADDLAAIHHAIAAAAAQGGGTVFFPAGRYRTTGPIAVTGSSVVLRGEGNASVIAPTGGFDTLVVRASTAGVWLTDVRIVDLLLDEAAKPSGRALVAGRVSRLVAERVHGVGGHDGLAFDAFTDLVLEHVRLADYRGGSGTAYLRLSGGANRDAGASSERARIHHLHVGGAAASSMKGVDIDGAVSQVSLLDVGLAGVGAEGLHARNSVDAAAGPSAVSAHGLTCDRPLLECVRLDSGTSFTFTGAQLKGSRSRANIHVGALCRSATFVGGYASDAQQAGIVVAGQDVCVSQMHFKANSSDALPGGVRNTYPGILITATARAVSITGCRSGEAASATYQRHGILVEGGADQYSVTGCVFTHNATSNISGIGPGGSRVIANNAA